MSSSVHWKPFSFLHSHFSLSYLLLFYCIYTTPMYLAEHVQYSSCHQNSLICWHGIAFFTTYIPTSLFLLQDSKEPPDCRLSESFTSSGCTLGVDLRRGRRRFSGNLQLPPLSWRQTERSRSPDDEIMARPTTLPFITPPRIDITPVDPEWWVRVNQLLSLLLNFNFRNLIYYKRCE